jgi:hypothetical protein
MAPPPPTDFSPWAPLWQRGRCVEPKAHRQAHQGDVGTQPKCCIQNPRQGEHSDIFRYTTEELRSVAVQYATSNVAAKLCLSLGSKEVTPSKGKEASPDVVIHSAEGGKKRCKQCPQGCIAPATDRDKRQARPPTNHFKRLLNEACPNHAYPVRHKLKDCDMMKSFMISGSLTRGMELDQNPGRSDMMPFPREDIVMTVYDGRPPPGRRHVSKLSTGTLTRCGWGHRGVKAQVFQYSYIYVNMYITTAPKDKDKSKRQRAR